MADAMQCGYCTSGMIMSSVALLDKTPRPTREQTRSAYEWQHLPLRYIPAHHCRNSNGRRAKARCGMNEFIEVERYELFREPAYNFAFDRRQFMKVFGGGLAFDCAVTNLLAQDRQQGESGRGGLDRNLPQEIGAWIHVDQDGSIKVYTGKVEFGQNIRTSLAQAVAEELHVPVSMIRLVMAIPS
jgi:CO/xanthine dehydrogenase Mo-binding subunit